MNLQTSKNLGILGIVIIFLDAILTGLTAIIPAFKNISLYNIPRCIGIIIVLISLYYLANIYQSKTIYTNARISAAAAIIGTSLTNVVTLGLLATEENLTIFIALGGLLIGLVILAVFLTVAAVFLRRSLNELATYTGISDFATVGQLLFIGAILTIVLFGSLIIGIAFLILAAAFSKMKSIQPIPSTTIETLPLPQGIPTTSNTEVKVYCPYCGTPIPSDAIFCTQCGKQI